MLEKPDLQDEKLVACLQNVYGLRVVGITFLPLGVDVNAAVYRAVTDDNTAYFVKIRRGFFDETSVALPKFLSDQGIAQIITPLTTQSGQLWTNLDAFTVIVYPFVEGHNGSEVALSDHLWRIFGAALRRIHTVVAPPAVVQRIQQETYSAQAREEVKQFLARAAVETWTDPVSVQVAALLNEKRTEILDLVGRAERLAQALQTREPPFVICHSDAHAWNVMIDAQENFYIVDWDNPILAPKERDLMFIGSGLGFAGGHTPQEEENLFYQGYGQTQVDAVALAYYRYERIVQDIYEFCKQLLLNDEGGEDREQSLRYLASNFLPGGVLEIANQSDRT